MCWDCLAACRACFVMMHVAAIEYIIMRCEGVALGRGRRVMIWSDISEDTAKTA